MIVGKTLFPRAKGGLMSLLICRLVGTGLSKFRCIKSIIYYFLCFLILIPNPSAYAAFQCKSLFQKEAPKTTSHLDHFREINEKDIEYVKSLININFDSLVDGITYRISQIRKDFPDKAKELDVLLANVEVLKEPEVSNFMLETMAKLIVRQNYNVEKLVFHKDFEVEVEKMFFEVIKYNFKMSREVEKELDFHEVRKALDPETSGVPLYKELKYEIDEFLRYESKKINHLIAEHREVIEKDLHHDVFTKNKIHWQYINPFFLYKFATNTMKNDVNQRSYQYKMLVTNAATTVLNSILAMKIAGVEITLASFAHTYLIFFLSYQSVEMVRNMITKATTLDARNRLFINWSLSMASYGFWSIALDVIFKMATNSNFNFDMSYYVYMSALLGYAAIWPLISQKVKEKFIYRVVQDGFPNKEDEVLLKSGLPTEVILNNFRERLSNIRQEKAALDTLIGRRKNQGLYSQKDIRKKIHRQVRAMMSENASNWHMIDHISTILRQVNYSKDKELQSLYQLEVERFKLESEEHRYVNLNNKWAKFFKEHNVDFLNKEQAEKELAKKYKANFFLINQMINSSMMGLYIVLKHAFVGESFYMQDGIIQKGLEMTTPLDVNEKYNGSNLGN